MVQVDSIIVKIALNNQSSFQYRIDPSIINPTNVKVVNCYYYDAGGLANCLLIRTSMIPNSILFPFGESEGIQKLDINHRLYSFSGGNFTFEIIQATGETIERDGDLVFTLEFYKD